MQNAEMQNAEWAETGGNAIIARMQFTALNFSAP